MSHCRCRGQRPPRSPGAARTTRVSVSRTEPRTAAVDERRAAAEIERRHDGAGSPILRRAQVTSSSKTWVRISSRSAREAEEDDERELLVAGHRHVRRALRSPTMTTASSGRRRPNTVTRPSMPGAPDERPEDHVVVGELVRERLPRIDEVVPDAGHHAAAITAMRSARPCGIEADSRLRGSMAARDERQDQPADQRADEDRSASGPSRPWPRRSRTGRRGARARSGSPFRPERTGIQPASSSEPANAVDHEHGGDERQPALGRAQRRTPRSRRGTDGRRVAVAVIRRSRGERLGERARRARPGRHGCRTRRGRAAGRATPARSAVSPDRRPSPGSPDGGPQLLVRPALERRRRPSTTTTHATPRARSVASGFTQLRSSDAVTTTAVIPRRILGTLVDQRLGQRRGRRRPRPRRGAA